MSGISFNFPNPQDMGRNHDLKALEAAKRAIVDHLIKEYMKPKEDFMRETLEWLMGKKAVERMTKKKDLREFKRLRISILDNIHKDLNLEIITVLQRGRVKAQRVFPYASPMAHGFPREIGLI